MSSCDTETQDRRYFLAAYRQDNTVLEGSKAAYDLEYGSLRENRYRVAVEAWKSLHRL
jgi:hypothetical protein